MSETMTLTQRKRLAIIEAAREEFLSQGFRETSMDRIAERAGASKRTVYNHFDSKEDLFRAITDELLAQFRQAICCDYDPEKPIAEQLRQIANREVELLTSETYIAIFRLFLVEASASPELSQQLFSAQSMEQDPIADWIKAATDDGRLATAQPEVASQQLSSLIKGAFFWPVIAGYAKAPTGRRRQALIDGAMQLFLDHYQVK